MARYHKRKRFNAVCYPKRRRHSYKRKVCKARAPKGSKTPIALTHSEKRAARGLKFKKVIMGPDGVNYRPHKKGFKKDGTPRRFSPGQIENMQRFAQKAKTAAGLPKVAFTAAMMDGGTVRAKIVDANSKLYNTLYPQRAITGGRYEKKATHARRQITPEQQARMQEIKQSYQNAGQNATNYMTQQGLSLVKVEGASTALFSPTGTIAPQNNNVINTTTTSSTFDAFGGEDPSYNVRIVPVKMEPEDTNMYLDAKIENGTERWVQLTAGEAKTKQIMQNGRWVEAWDQ